MKKIIGLGMVLALSLGLTACGGDSKKDSTASSSNKTEQTTKASSETIEFPATACGMLELI